VNAHAHAALEVVGLRKRFGTTTVLDGVTFSVPAGEVVAILGRSGSGKSTLLRCASRLIEPDAGTVRVGGVDITAAKGRALSSARARVGFVFQQFNLVGRPSVLVNVMAGALHRMPRWRALFGWFSPQEVRRAMEALQRVGIAECATQRASTLSGGQQQRAAIARALVQGARVILADEPIASLDPESSRRVMDILQRVNREDGVTVVVSLHQVNVALKYCPRTVALRAGRVVFDGPSGELTPALLRELYGAEADDILALPDHISALGDRAANEPRRPFEPELAAQAV
jgi:phosphonate transport system ATP-binding protein